jgi:hypothetical protein
MHFLHTIQMFIYFNHFTLVSCNDFLIFYTINLIELLHSKPNSDKVPVTIKYKSKIKELLYVVELKIRDSNIK